MFRLILFFALSFSAPKEVSSCDYLTKTEVVAFINSRLDTCFNRDGYYLYQISTGKHNQLFVTCTACVIRQDLTYTYEFEYLVYIVNLKNEVELMPSKGTVNCIRIRCKFKVCKIMKKYVLGNGSVYSYRQYTLPIVFTTDKGDLRDAFNYLIRISKLEKD
jgi:hypothetical protein